MAAPVRVTTSVTDSDLSTGNVTTRQITPSTPCEVGEVVTIWAFAGGSTDLSIADAQGNTWNATTEVEITSGALGTIRAWTCKVTTRITGAITVTRSTSGGLCMLGALLPDTYSATPAQVLTDFNNASTGTHATAANTVPAGGGTVMTGSLTNTGRTYSASAGTLLAQIASSGTGNPRVGGVAYIDTASAGSQQPVLQPSINNAFAAISLVMVEEVEENTAPVADAQADTHVRDGAAVILDGTGSSDSDGTITSYAWTQISGETVTITNDNQATASFTAPAVAGNLVFRLTVTDDDADTDTADVTIKVVVGRTAVICGDSLTRWLAGTSGTTREAATRALLEAAGYHPASIYWYGVGGKRMTVADSTGKTTAQVLADAKAELGFLDDVNIGLGTNDVSYSTAQFEDEADVVLDAAAALGVDRLTWTGISFWNPANTNAATYNPVLAATVNARAWATYLDWNTAVHTPHDDDDWIYPTDSTHMTEQGTARRDAFIVAAMLGDRFGASLTSVQTLPTGQGRKHASGGSIASVTTLPTGQGRKAASGGSGTGVATSTAGQGRKSAAGGSSALLATTPTGQGRKTAQGAASATSATLPTGQGRKAAQGGSLASVVTLATGDGRVEQAGQGSSTAQVHTLPTGAGVKHARGGSLASVQTLPSGAGEVVGAIEGSSMAQVLTWPTGVGRKHASGASMASVSTIATGSGGDPTHTPEPFPETLTLTIDAPALTLTIEEAS